MNTSCIANVSNSECKNETCQCVATYYQENKTCHTSEYSKYFVQVNKNNTMSKSTLHVKCISIYKLFTALNNLKGTML